jgi:hypothetical protein
MSNLGTYSFLPWLRQGLANQITSGDFDNSVKVRAAMNVQLEARGEKLGGGTQALPVNRPVALFGPGDIVGIDRRAIVRMEPRDWITNFEPNYLAHIEFYDEDFPWRYTPAAPDTTKSRLRPWITLLVLKEDEFKDGENIKDKPLPFIDVQNLNVFPRADELWAWAHVHVNRSLAANDAEFVSKNMDAVIPKLQGILGKDPDLAFSRLVCPRKLAPNESYHAFVIPTFETGRRAGLGLELGDISATMSAWDAGARPSGPSFPYYHRWYFRTGATGDFETLVRLLKPKPVNPRVGIREMDVLDPGSNVRPLDKPELGGILRLGGALRPPSKVPPEPPDKFEKWDDAFPRPLQEDLAKLVDLPDTYQAAGEPDPIVAPPLYGTWHALTKRVLTERDGSPISPNDNWVHRLNLDPRFRVPAGFGTRVIQDQQEKFMDAAWEQIGNVLEARRRIRFGQFGLLTSLVWYDRHLVPMLGVSRQKTLVMMAPLNKRILSDGATLHQTLSESFVQPAMTSAALRRIARPRARLIRSLPFDATRKPEQLFERVNASKGEISAAPPKVAPPGVVTAEQIADQLQPTDAPPVIVDWLRRYPQLPMLIIVAAMLLALLLLLILPLIGLIIGAALVGAAVVFSRRLSQWNNALRASDVLRESSQTPQAVDKLPTSSDFRITEPGAGFTARLGGSDSVEATRFKAALRNQFEMAQLSAEAGRVPPKKELNLDQLAEIGIKALDPARTIPKRIMAGLFIPPRLIDGRSPKPTETFVEPMAYPVIDLPMYEPLKKISSELFLPNINLIEHNSITLLETNQRFIESYMVGLNHEFARELLWREYPTDQRGSTFRQFWDVSSFFNSDNLAPEALKEKLRDIPPLHLWPKASPLGSHDNRHQGNASEEELVLVIRGELLKRYPTAVIYAHRACWQRKEIGAADTDKHPCERSGAIDNTQERRLAPLSDAEEAAPPRTKVLTPLYEAKVDPDIFFFGFDLTVEKAKGGTGENPADDPGWFFVIKERPGEARFGLDNEQPPKLQVWNDLSWPQVQPAPAGSYIEIATAPASLPLSNPTGEDSEKAVQHGDDVKVTWSRDMSSAELAYILFQAPVLVAVHASEMLPKPE